MDENYEDAVKIVREEGKASASLLQRKLRIGYAAAARLLDLMEENGVISEQIGMEPRTILPLKPMQESEISMQEEEEIPQETEKIDFSQVAADIPEDILPPRKMQNEMDFFELMEENINDFTVRRSLVESVIRNAQKGDAGALKILDRALTESKYKNEQKLIVTDDQLRNIVTLAADRYRGQGPLSAPSGTY